MTSYIVGLGGADITLDQMKQVYAELEQRAEAGKNSELIYLGIEE